MSDRSRKNVTGFLLRHAQGPLTEAQSTEVLRLLEMQRHAMLMYTSCGWFFDDVSGLEATQVIHYAGRVAQLAEQVFGHQIESHLLAGLADARSNRPDIGDARRLYEDKVLAAQVNLRKVGAHYALSWMLDDAEDRRRVYCYDVQSQFHEILRSGKVKLVVGRCTVTSTITWASADLTFAVLHFGDHNVSGGVRAFRDDAAFEEFRTRLRAAFDRGDITEALELISHSLELNIRNLDAMFRDEQRRMLDVLLESTVQDATDAHREVFERHVGLMRYLTSIGVPSPRELVVAGEVVLAADLRRLIAQPRLPVEEIRELLATASKQGIHLEADGNRYAMQETLAELSRACRERPSDTESLEELLDTVELARDLPFVIDLGEPQNACFDLANTVYPQWRIDPDPDRQEWVRCFHRLADELRVALPEGSDTIEAPSTEEPVED